MSKFKDVVVEALMPIIVKAGKTEIKTVLSNIKEHNNPEIFKDLLQSLFSNFSLLRQVTLESTTAIDDGIVELVLAAVKESAETENIILTP